MSLKVTTTDKGLGLALRRMVALLGPGGMKPVYTAVGSKLESNVHQRFDTKTDPSGEAWESWSAGTAAKREEEGRGTLLEYTGRMRDSLTFVADAQGVEVGFGVDYASYHEQVEPGDGRMPQRAMLFDDGDLSEEDKNDALAAAMRAFKKQLKLQGAQ